MKKGILVAAVFAGVTVLGLVAMGHRPYRNKMGTGLAGQQIIVRKPIATTVNGKNGKVQNGKKQVQKQANKYSKNAKGKAKATSKSHVNKVFGK